MLPGISHRPLGRAPKPGGRWKGDPDGAEEARPLELIGTGECARGMHRLREGSGLVEVGKKASWRRHLNWLQAQRGSPAVLGEWPGPSLSKGKAKGVE